MPSIIEPELINETKILPPYNVILINDEYHTYEYVIGMMQTLFGYPREKGYKLALEVDKSGRAIVLTTSKEHAELKRDQIHSFGADHLSSKKCEGSMTAVIEPAN